MERLIILYSADGLGHLTAKALIRKGHQVVLHARNAVRREQALKKAPGAQDVLVADLSSMEETKELASKANASGPFDVVIHNAGVYQVDRNSVGAEGLPLLLTVNSLAPYILTAMMHKPKRLVYLTSGMHMQGDPVLNNMPVSLDPKMDQKRGYITYSDTKLHDLILSMSVARKWADVYANAVDPGWVATKMGGAGAPDSLEQGFETQVWLATSNEPEACVSGCYFHHKRQARHLEAAHDVEVQESLLNAFERLTGVGFM